MKTERRHELQTNQLADWIGHQVEQVRPHLNIMLGISVLGAAIIIGYFVYAKDRQSTLQIAWGDYYLALGARDRDALEIVAKNHAGTIVELCAKQAQADLDLTNGIGSLYTNRDEAYRALNDAKKSYSDVSSASGATPELIQHSLFGLGQVNEATSNLDKAKEFYSKVTTQFPDSPMAVEAESRLKDLENPQVEKWYNWFARQKPKPPDPSNDMSSKFGFPRDLTKLPEKPDFPISPVIPPDGPTPDSKPVDDQPDSKPAENKTPAAKTPDAAPPATPDEAAKSKESAKKSEAPNAETPKSDSPKPETPKAETPVPSTSEKPPEREGESPKAQETKEDNKSTSPPAANKDAGPPPGR